MHKFDISRLHTSQGIFQLHGYFSASDINVEKLSMMGSDGWFELNLEKDNVKALILTLKKEFISHLMA